MGPDRRTEKSTTLNFASISKQNIYVFTYESLTRLWDCVLFYFIAEAFQTIVNKKSPRQILSYQWAAQQSDRVKYTKYELNIHGTDNLNKKYAMIKLIYFLFF